MIYINTDIYNFDLGEALAQISEQRREQALRFSHEEGQRLCVAAYMLLRHALLTEHGISDNVELGYEEGGKPYIKGYETIHFNLSHCRSAVACAIDSRPVGIDIEQVRPFKEALARHVLSTEEYEKVVSAVQPDVEFTRLWTMKESMLKLSGLGLRTDLKTLLPCSDVKHTTLNIPNSRLICTLCQSAR